MQNCWMSCRQVRSCRGSAEVKRFCKLQMLRCRSSSEVKRCRSTEVQRCAEVERLRDKEVQRGRCRYSSTLGAEGQRRRDAGFRFYKCRGSEPLEELQRCRGAEVQRCSSGELLEEKKRWRGHAEIMQRC